ncbi:type II restriction endonuclease [Microbacterium sp.]|uniref:type II restriction endonuclease n=1 Tax=Microbacterium sp. TaxID=51671 RepID=UPI0031FEF0D3|nr:type II restriction endonuclease [Microbacterium sp.]
MADIERLRDWLDHISASDRVLFAKRLSANDTGQTGGHQAGFYVTKGLARTIAPGLFVDQHNPRQSLRFDLLSHDQRSSPDLIYYNSRVVLRQPNGRDELRVTGFGGASSALQQPGNTGAILVTAWERSGRRVEAWLAGDLEEEEAVETVLGPVEPGTKVQRLEAADGQLGLFVEAPATCDPDISELPDDWARAFPAGRDLTSEAVRRRPASGQTVDARLVSRYRCEFGLFKVIETAHVLPLIGAGFGTVDDFLAIAQTVANRRKARAGRSLELHLATVFDEERVAYETGKTTEGNRRPDFLFPSFDAYHSGEVTRMLGVKTSVKERWRQVLDEAARIPEKHLFTLSEGVSEEQFRQMAGAGIRLVVPASNVVRFPATVRPHLTTLAGFVGLLR